MARKRSAAQRAADKSRTGRPPKQPADKWSQRVTVYMTTAERDRLQALAQKEGITMTSLIMGPWREGD
jgi:hypothetical protein